MTKGISKPVLPEYDDTVRKATSLNDQATVVCPESQGVSHSPAECSRVFLCWMGLQSSFTLASSFATYAGGTFSIRTPATNERRSTSATHVLVNVRQGATVVVATVFGITHRPPACALLHRTACTFLVACPCFALKEIHYFNII